MGKRSIRTQQSPWISQNHGSNSLITPQNGPHHHMRKANGQRLQLLAFSRYKQHIGDRHKLFNIPNHFLMSGGIRRDRSSEAFTR